MSGRLEGPNMVVNAEGVTVQALSGVFLAGPGAGLDRPVIDRTGLSGRYDIHLEYAPSDDFRRAIAGRQGDPGDPTAPPVFTALQQQLGLKLGPARGPGAFLVIDHVEHPGGP